MAEQEEYTASFKKNALISAPWWVRLCKVLWKIAVFIGGVVVVGLVLGVASTWLTSSRGEIPTDSPFRRLLTQWPITVPVGGCLLLIALLTFVLSRWESRETVLNEQAPDIHGAIEQQTASARPTPRLSPLDLKNRQSLLKRVRQIWIEGMLEPSLHQEALIALNLQNQPDALANPWRGQVQETNRAPYLLPAGTSIIQVYDKADGELLILGDPGAGKTTLLLDLARILLERAEHDRRQRMPVVFHLSSWAEKRQPLAVWLVEELWTKYQVPRKVGKAWIDSNQVLPLFDGLDEVAKEARLDCVQAINTYYQKRMEKPGSSPLIICCRIKEYMALSTQVTLQQAVTIQPLTDEQIERYLQNTEGQLEALQHALHNDSELYELARQPLMLNIFALAYQEARPEDLPTEGTREPQQRQVFATYVKRMLTRRGESKRFKREQTLRSLTFLAARMQQHDQTIFYLEHLQPSWLIVQQRRLLYRLSVGLLFALVGGLLGSLGGGLFNLVVAILLAQPAENGSSITTAGPTFGVGLVFCIAMLSIGLIFGLSQIRPRERLRWSWRVWRVTKRNITEGLLSGLSVGLLVGLLVLLNNSAPDLLDALDQGLQVGLLVGLVGMLVSGFFANQLDDDSRRTPNKGIWRSFQNGLLVGLPAWLLGLFGGLSAGLSYAQVNGPFLGLLVGLSLLLLVGLLFALPAGLIFGLGAFLQHFTLRFWLRRAGWLPWDLVAFLDEMVERLLLRKVGGGYTFVHRVLLEYFASLEKKKL